MRETCCSKIVCCIHLVVFWVLPSSFKKQTMEIFWKNKKQFCQKQATELCHFWRKIRNRTVLNFTVFLINHTACKCSWHICIDVYSISQEWRQPCKDGIKKPHQITPGISWRACLPCECGYLQQILCRRELGSGPRTYPKLHLGPEPFSYTQKLYKNWPKDNFPFPISQDIFPGSLWGLPCEVVFKPKIWIHGFAPVPGSDPDQKRIQFFFKTLNESLCQITTWKDRLLHKHVSEEIGLVTSATQTRHFLARY